MNMKKPQSKKRTTDVLYQRLGNDWYAFTEIDGECYMAKVDSRIVSEYMETAEIEYTDPTDLDREPKAA